MTELKEWIPAFLKGYSDSSFTNPHEVVLPETPPDCKGNFTHMGAKYWGFETRRHRATRHGPDGFVFDPRAHHWIDIGFHHQATVHRIEISTKWFTGNQVPEVSVVLSDRRTGKSRTVLSHVALTPDTDHDFAIDHVAATDCHIECYHEGGIARVLLFGETGEPLYARKNLLEDASISHTSNDHYGNPADAVQGTREVSHMVGWESARSGYGEHTLFTLPRPAVIDTIIVDTYLHRLNAPLSCHVFASHLAEAEEALSLLPRWKAVFADGHEDIPEDFQAYMLGRQFSGRLRKCGARTFDIRLHQFADSPWQPLISAERLRPDSWHEFNRLEYHEPVRHIYYMHYPNGGVHGLRMFGEYEDA